MAEMTAALPQNAGVAGLVLAGGRSSRFGGEKALAELCGKSLLARAVAGLMGVSTRVAVSVRAGSQTESLALAMGLPVVHDRGEIAIGPLAGVVSGLHWARSLGAQWLASLPCDVTCVPDGALEKLVTASGGKRAALVTTKRGFESLCALWPVDSARMLEDMLEQRTHPPMREVLRSLGAVEVAFEGDNIFLNINTRDDLARAEAIMIGNESR